MGQYSLELPSSSPPLSLDNLPEDEDNSAPEHGKRVLLFASVFIIASCGLVYELITGAVASYLVGNSVTQYSLVIGLFLAAMGIGAYVTKWINERLLFAFIAIQILIGIIGGLSTLFLFMAFKVGQDLTLPVAFVTLLIGALVGMEIPLLIRILKGHSVLQVTVPQVLALDYLGALSASLIFPFFLLPKLGLIRSAIVSGMLNLAVAGLGLSVFWSELRSRRRLLSGLSTSSLILIVAFALSDKASSWIEDSLYHHQLIFAEDSKYQRIVITQFKQDMRLYLNGHLQFSTNDEYRYHEMLVDPVMSIAVKHPEAIRRGIDVLILGGGDGLALRRVLDYPMVHSATVVDLDPRVVELFRTNPELRALNKDAYEDKRAIVIHDDAFSFLQAKSKKRYDVIIIDLPDPGTTATNKLFTKTFYSAALEKLTGVGGMVTQATSPYFAREAYWCIHNTMETATKEAQVGGRVPYKMHPYHVYVPAFGDWGFVLTTQNATQAKDIKLHKDGRYINADTLGAAYIFPSDMAFQTTKVNTLDKPILIDLHAKAWKKWNH